MESKARFCHKFCASDHLDILGPEACDRGLVDVSE